MKKSNLTALIDNYDEHKGMRRKIFGDSAIVSRLKQLLKDLSDDGDLDDNEEWRLFQILCAHKTKQSSLTNGIVVGLSQALFQIQIQEPEVNVIFRLYSALSTSPEIVNKENFMSIKQHENFVPLTNALYSLHAKKWSWPWFLQLIGLRQKMLTQNNFNAIKDHQNPEAMTSALNTLNQIHILNQDNFDAINDHQDPQVMAYALWALDNAHILNQDNRDAIKNHQDPGAINIALSTLDNAHILNQNNFNAIKDHQDPEAMDSALSTLNNAHILNQNNFNAIKDHQDPQMLASALSTLNNAHILNQDNRDAIKNHQDPKALASAFKMLHINRILNQDNRDAIKNHQAPEAIAYALIILRCHHSISNEKSLNAIKNNPNPRVIVNSLQNLETVFDTRREIEFLLSQARAPKKICVFDQQAPEVVFDALWELYLNNALNLESIDSLIASLQEEKYQETERYNPPEGYNPPDSNSKNSFFNEQGRKKLSGRDEAKEFEKPGGQPPAILITNTTP